ncbi:hypothetical protein [Bradyrhizobium sp. 23]|uniref:hypothetical protein n=1 Tax=Bradyrhizobium sp. 23 TaxID=2782667 RepID=UPI001FFAFD9A|nr:hypothetical protein [Bradyrhizobium sp. 23]MCK1314160.1 hypothetical protein [Bradyrhizobium sp. 23]
MWEPGASFGIVAARIILIARAAGSTVAFLLSRHISFAWFRGTIAQHYKLEAIANAVDPEGWRVVALMRLGVLAPAGSIQRLRTHSAARQWKSHFKILIKLGNDRIFSTLLGHD